jgi:UDPglucose--hexose-1-phosphate uridylyltransferase
LTFDLLADVSHRRYNPLTREWVLVSPQRLSRPWLGRTEAVGAPPAVPYDPECYLCPGNARAGAARNPRYEGTFVFDNDFPALTRHDGEPVAEESGLLMARAEPGICRVVCFSPRHDASIADLSLPELRRVVDAWVDEHRALSALPWVKHVQIFENRGAAMGASNPHPHCQIWANATVPDLPSREQVAQTEYRSKHGVCLLCACLAIERARAERIVYANGSFTALVPFWAVWPFEMLVIPNRHVTAIDELTAEERTGLADILKQIVARYDALFDAPCPYSMGFHQRPTDGEPHPEWHLHAHYYSPVLRSAAVHKFTVGYELLATPQRDLTPEAAAAILRERAVVNSGA